MIKVLKILKSVHRPLYGCKCMMGNQNKMAGNSKLNDSSRIETFKTLSVEKHRHARHARVIFCWGGGGGTLWF